MTIHKIRIEVGPTSVDAWADKIEAAGLNVSVRGTSTVYARVEADNGYAALAKFTSAMEKAHEFGPDGNWPCPLDPRLV